MGFKMILVLKFTMTNVVNVDIFTCTSQEGIEKAREIMLSHQDAEWAILMGEHGILQTWGSPVIRVIQ